MVISTGKSDWEFDVTSESGSLASYLSSATGSGPKLPKKPKPEGEGTNGTKESSSTKDGDGSTTTAENQEKEKPKEKKRDVGLFTSSSQKRISILNGSHHTVCDDPTLETVLLFPDFKIITEVEKSRRGAEQLWQTAVSPAVGRAGVVLPESTIRTWVIPYSCVILLCESFFLSYDLNMASEIENIPCFPSSSPFPFPPSIQVHINVETTAAVSPPPNSN